MEMLISAVVILAMIILVIMGIMHFIPSDYHVLGYIIIGLVSIFFVCGMYYICYGSWTNINDTHLGRQLMSTNYTTVHPIVLAYYDNDYHIKAKTRLLINPDDHPSKYQFELLIAPGFTFQVRYVYYVDKPLYGRNFEIIIEPVSKPIIIGAIETELDVESKTFRWKQINNFDKFSDIVPKSFNLYITQYTSQFFTLDESGTLEQVGNRTPIIRDNITRTQLAIA
jgi:hypothetical protein